MRATATALLAAILVVPASMASTRQFHNVTPIGNGGRVSVDSHNGTVEVLTWNQPNVGVDARIEPGEMSSHPEDVDRMKIKVNRSGANVDIISDYSDIPDHVTFLGINRSLPLVHYTIHVPPTSPIKVEVHNAHVKVSGLTSDVLLRSHNGMIEAMNLQGAADVETHNGAVHVDFANFTRPSRVETHNGSVDVVVPQNARMTLRVDGDRYRPLSSDFPVTLQSHGSRSTASVNGGGPELTFSSHNGYLHLKKR